MAAPVGSTTEKPVGPPMNNTKVNTGNPEDIEKQLGRIVNTAKGEGKVAGTNQARGLFV